jgi:hypothetical protein
MDSKDIEQAAKLYSFDDLYKVTNDIDEQLKKQTNLMEKPNSMVQRVFVDFFGIITLYGLLFFLCDITQSFMNDRPLFGIEWIFFGPYYFLTGAPLLTRIWKSKKFLEDLSELERGSGGNYHWRNEESCSAIGIGYINACNTEEAGGTLRRHPIKNKLGKGLDWVLSHLIGGKLGKIINNSNCEEQGQTVSRQCAADRVQAAYDCYVYFCGEYGIENVAPLNGPNFILPNDPKINTWTDGDKRAYGKYYEVYLAVYQVLYDAHGVDPDYVPENLNPAYDSENTYCYNARALFDYNTFFPPPWWSAAQGETRDQCFFQQTYKDYYYSYWDPVV